MDIKRLQELAGIESGKTKLDENFIGSIQTTYITENPLAVAGGIAARAVAGEVADRVMGEDGSGEVDFEDDMGGMLNDDIMEPEVDDVIDFEYEEPVSAEGDVGYGEEDVDGYDDEYTMDSEVGPNDKASEFEDLISRLRELSGIGCESGACEPEAPEMGYDEPEMGYDEPAMSVNPELLQDDTEDTEIAKKASTWDPKWFKTANPDPSGGLKNPDEDDGAGGDAELAKYANSTEASAEEKRIKAKNNILAKAAALRAEKNNGEEIDEAGFDLNDPAFDDEGEEVPYDPTRDPKFWKSANPNVAGGLANPDDTAGELTQLQRELAKYASGDRVKGKPKTQADYRDEMVDIINQEEAAKIAARKARMAAVSDEYVGGEYIEDDINFEDNGYQTHQNDAGEHGSSCGYQGGNAFDSGEPQAVTSPAGHGDNRLKQRPVVTQESSDLDRMLALAGLPASARPKLVTETKKTIKESVEVKRATAAVESYDEIHRKLAEAFELFREGAIAIVANPDKEDDELVGEGDEQIDEIFGIGGEAKKKTPHIPKLLPSQAPGHLGRKGAVGTAGERKQGIEKGVKVNFGPIPPVVTPAATKPAVKQETDEASPSAVRKSNRYEEQRQKIAAERAARKSNETGKLASEPVHATTRRPTPK